MAMNQQLVATMLRRMDLEEERRNKAEEKVLEAAEAAKKAAVAAQTRDPFQPSTAPSSSTAAPQCQSNGAGDTQRAEINPAFLYTGSGASKDSISAVRARLGLEDGRQA